MCSNSMRCYTRLVILNQNFLARQSKSFKMLLFVIIRMWQKYIVMTVTTHYYIHAHFGIPLERVNKILTINAI